MRKAMIKLIEFLLLSIGSIGNTFSQDLYPKGELNIANCQQKVDKRITESQKPLEGSIKKSLISSKNAQYITTVISVNGVDLAQLIELRKVLLHFSFVKLCKPSIEAKRIFILTVSHTVTEADFVENIRSKIGKKYVFDSFSNGVISLSLLKS